jgi:hypothetical protein
MDNTGLYGVFSTKKNNIIPVVAFLMDLKQLSTGNIFMDINQTKKPAQVYVRFRRRLVPGTLKR